MKCYRISTHHFKIVLVKLFKSFLDNDPEFSNGFITDAQSTPPLCAAIFLFMIYTSQKKLSNEY